MKIIKPYNLSVYSIDELLYTKKIMLAKDHKIWHSAIFPKSTTVEALSKYDKDNIITQIDDNLFENFTILNNMNQMIDIYTANVITGRKFIKSKEIGDYDNSIKRYTQLDKPIDYSNNIKSFLNLPKMAFDQQNDLNIILPELIHNPDGIVSTFEEKKDPFDFTINHPHIFFPKSNNAIFKHNNKIVIGQIFKWAAEQGIKYIYCIDEWRPYAFTTDYTIPYVYYTINGSF